MRARSRWTRRRVKRPREAASRSPSSRSVKSQSTSSDPAASLFPSNRYTVFDGAQKTLRRVQLPKPDCAVRVSDCQDIDVINTLHVAIGASVLGTTMVLALRAFRIRFNDPVAVR